MPPDRFQVSEETMLDNQNRVIDTPGATRCPNCGQAMEPGVLAAECLVGGAKWMRKRSRLSLGGEGLVSPDTWGNVYFDGFRCRHCRVLVVGY